MRERLFSPYSKAPQDMQGSQNSHRALCPALPKDTRMRGKARSDKESYGKGADSSLRGGGDFRVRRSELCESVVQEVLRV